MTNPVQSKDDGELRKKLRWEMGLREYDEQNQSYDSLSEETLNEVMSLISTHTALACLDTLYSAEVWKPYTTPPYTGKYEVSSAGRVRRGDLLLKQSNAGAGYYVVSLSENNVSKNMLVHRLVAQTFLVPGEGQIIVNHKDGVKTNNAVNNLEWCDYSHNNSHAIRLGLNKMIGADNHQAKLKQEDVEEIKTLMDSGMTQTAISERFGVSFSLISRIHRNVAWKHLLDPDAPPPLRFNRRKSDLTHQRNKLQGGEE